MFAFFFLEGFWRHDITESVQGVSDRLRVITIDHQDVAKSVHSLGSNLHPVIFGERLQGPTRVPPVVQQCGRLDSLNQTFHLGIKEKKLRNKI